MLQEFVSKIEALAKKACSVEVIRVPEIPDKVGVRNGDAFTWIGSPPPKRAHLIHSFQDFAAVVREASELGKAGPEVFHSDDKIVVLLDREERREQITMNLVHTERWRAVVNLGPQGKSFTAPEAVRFIRFDLHGVGADALIPALRKVDFTRKGTGASTTEHGKESLGKSVEAAVQSAEGIPENFVAEVPLFANPGIKGIRAKIRFAIYLDVMNEAIVIRPLADEINAAIEAAQSALHELLMSAVPTLVPVYNGQVLLKTT